MGLLNKILKKRQQNIPTELKSDEKDEPTDKVAKVEVDKTKTEKQTAVKTTTKEVKSKDGKTTIKKLKILPLYSKADKVLLYPLVTEKAAAAESLNQYSFVVANWSSKKQIKEAIIQIYGVKPSKIRTINVEGKTVSFRRRKGKRVDRKKAIVTLPKGKSIDIHQGV